MMYFDNFRMDEDVQFFHYFLKILFISLCKKRGFVNEKILDTFSILFISIVFHWKVCIHVFIKRWKRTSWSLINRKMKMLSKWKWVYATFMYCKTTFICVWEISARFTNASSSGIFLDANQLLSCGNYNKIDVKKAWSRK